MKRRQPYKKIFDLYNKEGYELGYYLFQSYIDDRFIWNKHKYGNIGQSEEHLSQEDWKKIYTNLYLPFLEFLKENFKDDVLPRSDKEIIFENFEKYLLRGPKLKRLKEKIEKKK